jgi:nanoRNase/pAp phosphatase (c-di-AMP/oligoRNAs hydrolase)
MHRKNKATRRIEDFLKKIGNRRLWIQTHDIPDPDALASAEALRVIARSFDIRAQIVCNGLPHRRENKAMIKECAIHLHPLDSVRIRSSARSAWAFIDCLPGGGNVTLNPNAPGDIYLAIDHHGKPGFPIRANKNAFIIYEPGLGATATLLGSALLQLEISFPPRLASAISYAIITDTQDFSRGASKTDLEIYAAMFPFTNQKIISRLRTVSKSREYFRILHRGLDNAAHYRHVAWVNIGSVVSGENVAEVADFILSGERITWSLTLGYTADRLLLSIRSSQKNARCSRVIHRIIRDFDGTAGGHNEFAGGFIRLVKDSDPDAIAEKVIRLYISEVLRLNKSADIPSGTPLVEKDDDV